MTLFVVHFHHFVRTVKNLDDNLWLLFHCQGGPVCVCLLFVVVAWSLIGHIVGSWPWRWPWTPMILNLSFVFVVRPIPLCVADNYPSSATFHCFYCAAGTVFFYIANKFGDFLLVFLEIIKNDNMMGITDLANVCISWDIVWQWSKLQSPTKIATTQRVQFDRTELSHSWRKSVKISLNFINVYYLR